MTTTKADRLEEWRERLSWLDPYDDSPGDAIPLAEELFAEVERLRAENARLLDAYKWNLPA